MQQESTNSPMVISPSAQCRPSMADISTSTLYSIFFHNTASPSTYTTPSLTSDGKSTKNTISITATSVTAAADKSLSLTMIKQKDLLNLYDFCLNQLRKIFIEAETLHQENTNLRLANAELSNQVNLLIQATLQNTYQTPLISDSPEQYRSSSSSLSSVGGSFEKKTESGSWDEGFSSPKSVIEKSQGECHRDENDNALVNLPKSISARSNGFQKFAGVIRSSSASPRSATRFRASHPAAGPPSSSSSSPSSSSSSELFKPKESSSSEGGQEEVIQSVVGEDGEEKYLPRFRHIPVFHRVHLIGDQSYQDTKLTEVSLYEAYGYFTFAREVRGESPSVDEHTQPTLSHVCCPWLPQFSKTVYYAETRRVMEILLDPLILSWESFICRIDKIVMSKGEEPIIRICVFKGEILEYDLSIPKSAVLDSYEKFSKAIYFYHAAYIKRDPEVLSPIYFPWPYGVLEYYDAQGLSLDMPEEEESNGEEEESTGEGEGSDEEEREEEEVGEIVDQVSSDEKDDNQMDEEDGMHQEGQKDDINQDEEEDDINQEDEDGADMEEATPWRVFMNALFSVHIRN